MSSTNEYIITDVPQKLHVRRIVDFVNRHLERHNTGLPDYNISACLNLDTFGDLSQYLGKVKQDQPLKLTEQYADALVRSFRIVHKIIKSSYGESLFNDVLNSGHKKSSKKEYTFLSQDWNMKSNLYAEQIFHVFPALQEKMQDILSKFAQIQVS